MAVCGYRVVAELASSQVGEPDFLGPSFQAIDPAGRAVVLKPLDPDCLYKDGLHPNIKERLGRVREMAVGAIANLRGVERDDEGKAWLVWEHLPGVTLTEHAAGIDPKRAAAALRQLVLVVESLHHRGVVHGAIRAGNAIVDGRGAVRLTHVSPLLYADPADDVWGVTETLREVVKATDADGPLGRVLADLDAGTEAARPKSEPTADDLPAPDDAAAESFFRRLAAKLSAVTDEPIGEPPPAEVPLEADVGPRRRSLVGAGLAGAVGAAVAVATWWAVRRPTGR